MDRRTGANTHRFTYPNGVPRSGCHRASPALLSRPGYRGHYGLRERFANGLVQRQRMALRQQPR